MSELFVFLRELIPPYAQLRDTEFSGAGEALLSGRNEGGDSGVGAPGRNPGTGFGAQPAAELMLEVA